MARCRCEISEFRIAGAGQPYSAVALSLVFHSAKPHVPTFRADVRCFEARGHARILSNSPRLASPRPAASAAAESLKVCWWAVLPPQVAGVGAWFGGGADLTPFYLFEEARAPSPALFEHCSIAAVAMTCACCGGAGREGLPRALEGSVCAARRGSLSGVQGGCMHPHLPPIPPSPSFLPPRPRSRLSPAQSSQAQRISA